MKRPSGPRLLRPSARRFGIGLFLAAFGLRLGFLSIWRGHGAFANFVHDPYYEIALAWLGWGPMPGADFMHPPLYPAFLASVLALRGAPGTLAPLAAQCLLSAGACLLVWRLGARLAGEEAGRLAGIWAAADPPLIFFTPQLMSEVPFVFMELGFFAALLAAFERGGARRFLGAGLVGGLAALCRSVLGAFPVLAWPALLAARGRSALGPLLLLSIGWLAPLLAWGARNRIVHGAFVTTSAQTGWSLYEGFTLDREEIKTRPVRMFEEAHRLGLDGVEADAYFKAKFKRLVADDPFGAARVVVGKAFSFWRPWPYDPYTPAQRALIGAYFVLLFALAAAGCLGGGLAPGDWAPVGALFVYLTVLHSVFFTSLRYRLPLEPFLCILAARGALRLLRHEKRAEAR